MAGRFTVETVFKAIDRITAPVTRMQNRVGKFTRGVERGLRRANRATNRFFKGMKTGAVAAAASLLIVATAMGNVVKIGADFEQQIVNATVKMAGIDKASARFTDTLRDLEAVARKQGATTEFTASQAAAALNNLARSGFNVKQSIAALPGVIDFATTSETDLMEATEAVTGALAVFGLKAKDSVQLVTNLSRVNDVLAKTANSSKASMADLAETLKDGGGAAALAGQDVETFGALAAFMAEGLIKGTKAGTTMKSMFTKLATPSVAAQRIFRKLGVDVKDSKGDFNDIADILGQLEKGLVGVGSAEKTAILDEIFGLRAVIGVNKILEAGVDNFRDFRKELRGANGESRKMAAIMRDTVGGSLKALTSIIESIKISVFNLRKEGLKGMIDSTVAWLRANEALIASKVDKFITKVGTAISFLIKHRVGIGRTIAVVMGLVIAMKILIGVLTLVNLVMSANPISLIIIGIAFLIGLIVLLVKNWDKVKAAFLSLPGPVKIALALMFPVISLLIGMAKMVMDNWEPIKAFFADLWGGVVIMFESAVDRVAAVMETMMDAVKKVKAAIRIIKTAGGVVGSKIGEFFGRDGEEQLGAATGRGNESQVVSPQARTARSIEERRSFSTAEVTIKDDTGRAEVTSGALGTGLVLLPSGAF